MVLFEKGRIPIREIEQLREQGYSDNQIIDELEGKGYSLPQINNALAQVAIRPEIPGPPEMGEERTGEEAPSSLPGSFPSGEGGGAFSDELGGRIEEIAESIIDEKWDLLIEEVKKIIEWKEKVEEEVRKLSEEAGKLKEDFKELHRGVLGKLEDYDARMAEVGTELRAVGKVFKEVVPEFVENVKELKAVTKGVKRKK